MIGLIQRVSRAQVDVDGVTVGQIERGIMLLLGVEKADTPAIAERLLERVVGYRIFADDQGKMNLSLREVAGGLLIVPQFTLPAAPPEQGRALFDYFVERARLQLTQVQTGVFSADMQVALTNDGPVTFWLQV